MTGALPGSAFQRVNNMLPGSEGAKPPIAVPSSLWSGFLTSRLCSWKRQELTVVKQRQRRRRVTSETTCVKNSRPKCCVCCQRPPMARPSTARATQVSCPTNTKNTCVLFATVRPDRLRSERTHFKNNNNETWQERKRDAVLHQFPVFLRRVTHAHKL